MIPTFGSKSKLYEIIYNMCSWYDVCLKNLSKPQWNTISHPLGWLFFFNAKQYLQNVEKLEHLLVVL